MPGNCFYHHICQWCNQQESNYHIKTCSGCRLVSYCSVEHQKYDWFIHKKLCRAVGFIQRKGYISLFSFEGTTQDEWNRHRTQFMCSIELLGNKKLAAFERQMILFPNVCNVCFKYNHSYNPCVDCLCAYYCCEEHLEVDRKEHSKSCKELKLCFDVDLFLKDGPINLSKFLPLNKKDMEAFPSNMNEFMEIYYEPHTVCEKVAVSEEFSFMLTLIFSLLKSRKDYLNSITIHVIGAGEHECEMDKFVEIFFHWLPQIKQITMLLIGPECIVNSANSSQIYKFKGKYTLQISRVNDKLYHEYITKPDFVSPYVAIAYNCGFSEFVDGGQDTWSETIQCILNFRKILFITTSYNKLEAENDFIRVVKNNVNNSSLNIIKRAERNPFRSLRPLRDWECSSHIFYVNNFISILYVH